MQIMEGDIARSLQKHLARIAHVQLDAIGYRGWIGCEYKPRTTTVEGLGWHAALTADT